jgi:3-dehydroquinate synthase
MDKKREKGELHYVVLEKVGKGIIKSVSLKQIERIVQDL